MAEFGQIRVVPILEKNSAGFPAGHLWGAEYDGVWASALTKEKAIERLKEMMTELGRVAPNDVYDVAGSIGAWMN